MSAQGSSAFVDVSTLLEAHARRRADKIFVESPDQGSRITFAEFEGLTRRFANFLASEGIRHGDRVSVLADNGIEPLVVFWGALRAGVIVNPAGSRNFLASSSGVNGSTGGCFVKSGWMTASPPGPPASGGAPARPAPPCPAGACASSEYVPTVSVERTTMSRRRAIEDITTPDFRERRQPSGMPR